MGFDCDLSDPLTKALELLSSCMSPGRIRLMTVFMLWFGVVMPMKSTVSKTVFSSCSALSIWRFNIILKTSQ